MSRVQLLRQRVGDYQKRNLDFNTQVEGYNQRAEEFNTFINQMKATRGMQAINKLGENNYELVVTDKRGQIQPAGGVTVMPSEQIVGTPVQMGDEFSPAPTMFGKNPDGTFTHYAAAQDATGELVYQPWGSPVRSLNFDEQAPVADARTQRPPNLTMQEERTLESPPTNPAATERSRGTGVNPTTELAGDTGTSAGSPFADLKGGDPKGLKDRGILAQVLGGQL